MKHGFTRSFSLIGVLIFVTAGFAQTPAVPGKAARTVTRDLIVRDLAEALSVIEMNYGGDKKLDENRLIRSSIDGMLQTLDPYSQYTDVKEMQEAQFVTRSSVFGIGTTTVALNDEKGKVIATYVRSTSEGSPANAAGLKYGDKIIEIDGTSMLGKTPDIVNDKTRGPRGTKVKITVERLASGKRETIEIIRGEIPRQTIGEVYMIRPGIGYMQMNGGFNWGTYDEFDSGLRLLKDKGMTELVLDLRDNGGGQMWDAYLIASRFLSKGQVVATTKGRGYGATHQLRVESSMLPKEMPVLPEKMPVVVLVNGRSASASELLAGALQDHDCALIVGEKTFGKGLVQSQIGLHDGSMLTLTTAKYQTPSGRVIQRDYSNGHHDYQIDRHNDGAPQTPNRPESKTDIGRVVYGGGAIDPDVLIKPKTIPAARRKLSSPTFAFAMELVAGRVKGFEAYKVDGPIKFNHDIAPSDFPVSDDLIQEFKTYAAGKYQIPAARIDAERDFVSRQLRYELITAAYGSRTAQQVLDIFNDQIQRAVDQLPQAKQLFAERVKLNTVTKQKYRRVGRKGH